MPSTTYQKSGVYFYVIEQQLVQHSEKDIYFLPSSDLSEEAVSSVFSLIFLSKPQQRKSDSLILNKSVNIFENVHLVMNGNYGLLIYFNNVLFHFTLNQQDGVALLIQDPLQYNFTNRQNELIQQSAITFVPMQWCNYDIL